MPSGVYQRSVMTLEDRYSIKVDVRGPNECWPWNAGVNKKGYGIINSGIGNSAIIATRVGWMIKHGEYPEPDMKVCHTCDNPPCQNPAHWFLGTEAQNSADKVAKGRQARGENHAKSKLSDRQVKQLRAEYAQDSSWGRQTVLAKKYGISSGTISLILSGQRW